MWYAGLWTTSSTSAASAASTSRSSTPTWSSSTALIPDQPAPSSSEISSRVEHWTMMMMNIFRDSNGNFLVAGRSKAISTKHFTHCPCFQNLKLKLLHLKQIYINESRLCHYLFYIERSSYNSGVLCVSAIFWLSIFLLSSNLSYLCNQKSQSYWLSICRIYLSVSLSFFYLSIYFRCPDCGVMVNNLQKHRLYRHDPDNKIVVNDGELEVVRYKENTTGWQNLFPFARITTRWEEKRPTDNRCISDGYQSDGLWVLLGDFNWIQMYI